MKQAKFIIVSLLVCIALILVVRAMYMATGGSGLGPYLIAAFITGAYTLYTIITYSFVSPNPSGFPYWSIGLLFCLF